MPWKRTLHNGHYNKQAITGRMNEKDLHDTTKARQGTTKAKIETKTRITTKAKTKRQTVLVVLAHCVMQSKQCTWWHSSLWVRVRVRVRVKVGVSFRVRI
jgi:hypothetical protein